MEIECLYTLANEAVRLQFLAMERSLRATGCDLPIRLLPYDERTFPLPKNSEWFQSGLNDWLAGQGAMPMYRKYHCLTQANYVYADSDIVFLTDPRETLAPLKGFVVADTEWSKPEYTYTPESRRILSGYTSLWLRRIFNAGFFASDCVLYTEEALRKAAERPGNTFTCLHDNDQTGLNLLIAQLGIIPTNLNMPPFEMESTWAGDYHGEYEPLWQSPERKPTFIHWAGPILNESCEERPINRLFLEFLTTEERQEWNASQAVKMEKERRKGRWPFGVRLLNQFVKRLYPRYHVQPKRS